METNIRVYSLKQVADIMGLTRQTIYNYVTAGKLKARKIGKEYRVKEEDLKEFIDKGV